MLRLNEHQQILLDTIYAHVRETGRWPFAKELHHELFRVHRLKLEQVCEEIGLNFVMCNDVSQDGAICWLRLPALGLIEAAAQDRDLIGKFVPWLVSAYIRGEATGLTPEIVAQALGSEAGTIRRVVGFLSPVGGLVSPEQAAETGILGYERFRIDDRVIFFDDVRTYDDILIHLSTRHSASRNNDERSLILDRESSVPLFRDSTIGDPLEGLHPAVRAAATTLFQTGHFGQALQTTFTAFEANVLEMSGLQELSGQDLMSKAFHGTRETLPKLAINRCVSATEKSEQLGLKLMAMAAMALIRNPFSHPNPPETNAVSTFEMLAVASLLFRQLDRVKNFLEESQEG